MLSATPQLLAKTRGQLRYRSFRPLGCGDRSERRVKNIDKAGGIIVELDLAVQLLAQRFLLWGLGLTTTMMRNRSFATTYICSVAVGGRYWRP